jgi:hypothetical protein
MQMRLESTKVAMVWLPLSVIGYAWVCQERVHVAAMCVMLFLAGFLSMYVTFVSHFLLVSSAIDGSTPARWHILLMQTLVAHQQQ